MKPSSFAPVYAAFYPMLADISHRHGYALCIHGSLQRDLDICAVPWTETASTPEALLAGIVEYAGCAMAMMFDNTVVISLPEMKPHGRIAYSIKVGNGAVVDLSIMPPVLKEASVI